MLKEQRNLLFGIIMVFALSFSTFLQNAYSAKPSSGGKCLTVGAEILIAGKKHTCAGDSSNRLWILNSSLKSQTFNFSPIFIANILQERASEGSFPIQFRTNSPLSFKFTASPIGICKIEDSEIKVLSGGQCNIFVDQQGSGRFRPFSKSFVFTIPKKIQKPLSYSLIEYLNTSKVVPFGTIIPTSFDLDSMLPVTLTASPTSVCLIQGLSLLLQTPGTCQLLIENNGNNFYKSYKYEGQIIVSKKEQSLIVSQIPAVQLFSRHSESSSEINLNVTSSSGLTSQIRSQSPNICNVIDGIRVRLINQGDCILEIQQPGNELYLPSEIRRLVFGAQPDCTLSSYNLIYRNIPNDPQPTFKWTCYVGKRIIASPWCCTYTPNLYAYEYRNGSRIQRSEIYSSNTMFRYEGGAWIQLNKIVNTSYAFGKNVETGGGACSINSATGIKVCQEGGYDVTEIEQNIPGLRNYCFASPQGIASKDTSCDWNFQIEWILRK